MRAGDVMAERFEMEREAAAGGMGRIWRARDRLSGAAVAVKLLHAEHSATARARFLEEAAVLAEIEHPGIVRYVAHGETPAGDPYLVMEWLAGEDLGRHLRQRRVPAQAAASSRRQGAQAPGVTIMDGARTGPTQAGARASAAAGGPGRPVARKFEPLPVATAVRFGRRLAAAVAELHRRGIVHRDIKPANLFLPGGDLDQVKLLDLGTAWRPEVERLTRPGQVLGTPMYMAPEQARARGAISPATDVWAMGCVLYLCLTGVAPFAGEDVAEVLARVVLEAPAPVGQLAPEVPAELAALVMRMLAKDPTRRPHDAAEVAATLGALAQEQAEAGAARCEPEADVTVQDAPGEDASLSSGPCAAESITVLTDTERRVMCMLLVDAARSSDAAEPAETGAALASHGGQVHELADRTWLVTVPGTPEPARQAAVLARTALALREAAAEVPAVLVTGRVDGDAPIGELVSAAVRMVRAASPGLVRLDERTAALVEARFEVRHDPAGPLLGREHAFPHARALPGKATPWVGRRREVAALVAAFDECVEERVARAVLVTAEPGMGKTRLCQELLQRLRGRGQELELLYATADAASAGSPLAMLARGLRAYFGIEGVADGEPLELARQALGARLAALAAGPEVDMERTRLFLGELMGVPFAADAPALASARTDPMFRSQLMEAAWEDWLAATCARRPMMLVLDDLHWGDLPTVQYVDRALRALAQQPLLVLALARPEVHMVFPKLWAKRGVHEIPLHALSTRDSAALVHAARREQGDAGAGSASAPAGLDDTTLAALIERAGGNAFFLEELVRALAAGHAQGLPDTVLGMVQVRLEALGPEARRVLRAASVFGEAFWQGGVEALVGAGGSFAVDEWLAHLVAHELVAPEPSPRLAGQAAYRFVHALVRDAAYAMLTDEDRRMGHFWAGAWLERAGEPDPLVVAAHFARGGAPGRARSHLAQAAQQALASCDFEAALARAEQAVAADAAGEIRGRLRAIQAAASFWQTDYVACQRYGSEAVALLAPGSSAWYGALGDTMVASFRQSDHARCDALLAELSASVCAAGAESKQLICLSRVAYHLVMDARVAQANPLLAHIQAFLDTRRDEIDMRLLGQLHSVLAVRARFDNELAAAFQHAESAVVAFEAARDVPNTLVERNTLALAWISMGFFDRGVELCRRNMAECQDHNLPAGVAAAMSHLGFAMSLMEQNLEQGRQWLERALVAYRRTGNRRMEGLALARLANLELVADNAVRAERLAGRAVVLLERVEGFVPWVLGVHAHALVRLGRVAKARVQVERGVEVLARVAGSVYGGSSTLVALAEVRRADGDMAGARSAMSQAAAAVRERAARLADPDWRAQYLRMPVNQRILALADEWAGGAPAHPG
jgi:serine/threonine protein kinase